MAIKRLIKTAFIGYLGAIGKVKYTENEMQTTCLNNNAATLPLHKAIALGDIETVKKILFLQKTSVNSCDSHHRTPLHLAVVHQQVEILPILFDAGSCLLKTDNKGRTPHELATEIDKMCPNKVSKQVIMEIERRIKESEDKKRRSTWSERNPKGWIHC